MYKHAQATKLSTDSESAGSRRYRANMLRVVEKLGLPNLMNITGAQFQGHITKSRALLLQKGVSQVTISRLPPLLFRYEDVIRAYRVWCEIVARRDETNKQQLALPKRYPRGRVHRLPGKAELSRTVLTNPELETVLSAAFKKARNLAK